MEFHERLQELRKQKGLTQEELAQALFVSRTAVSKWESGRGYPNIDSLKAISAFFSVTIDELLSSKEALTLAEEDHRQKERHLHSLIFGLLDCSALLLLFLPFFAEKEEGMIRAVSLLSMNNTAIHLKILYFSVVIATIISGIVTLVLQNHPPIFCQQIKYPLSVASSIAGIFLFIISPQPYAAALLFVFLLIKGLILLKKP